MSESDESIILISDSSDDSIIEVSDNDSQDDSIDSTSEKLVFLDLTNHEIVEDKQHTVPNATAEDLVKISEQFVKDQNSENDDDRSLNFSNVTIRKRNRFNTTNNEETTSHIQNTDKYEIEPKKSFLESLDDKIQLEIAHPESVKFKKFFRRHRDQLVEKLIVIYNERVFQNKLNHVPWGWSKWIGGSGGRFQYHIRNGERLGVIFLSEQLMTSAERVRDVLLHELCHAAVYFIDKQIEKELDGHGKLWQYWGQVAQETFPEIPPIQLYHHYKITHKYKYKCTICFESSLSNSKLKTNNIFCAHCHGPVQLFRVAIKNGRRVTVALRKPGSFALFVKENYRMMKTNAVTHAGVMKALSEQYSKLTVSQKQMYRKSFGGLP